VTAPPFVPGPLRRFDESHQTRIVATDAEVVEVASYASIECNFARIVAGIWLLAAFRK
jgi:hypothetical protein